MTQPAVAPCVYPGCDDGHGNPALTTQTMCGQCRRRYWKRLEWLTHDYVILKTGLPSPVRTEVGKPATSSKSFGHPAQWASDTCREIARLLNDIEDDLREVRGDEPPPNEHTAGESRIIAHAWNYISVRFDALCEHPAAGDLAEQVVSLHSRIRGAQGYRRHFRYLPGVQCRVCDITGYMVAGDGEGTDRISCEKCGADLPADLVEHTIRTVGEERLADLVAQFKTRRAASLTKN